MSHSTLKTSLCSNLEQELGPPFMIFVLQNLLDTVNKWTNAEEKCVI